MLAYRARDEGQSVERVLMLGDFNTTPDSPIYAHLSGEDVLCHSASSENWLRYLPFYTPHDHRSHASSQILDSLAPDQLAAYHEKQKKFAQKIWKQRDANEQADLARKMQLLQSRLQRRHEAIDRAIQERMQWTLQLRSAHVAVLGKEPPFTTYTPGFQNCIDYAWFAGGLQVTHALEMPSEEVVSKHGGGLPNEQMSSDHLPIAFRFEVV